MMSIRLYATAAAATVGCIATLASAQSFTWTTVVNNADYVPACGDTAAASKLFNSYSQPSVSDAGVVAFRGRSKGSDGGGGGGEANAAAGAGKPARGVYTRNMRTAAPPVAVACVGAVVPQPNNAYYNGVLASFNEFPAFPRIDAESSTVATRGQSQPVWEYTIGLDPTTGLPLTTKTGTSGVYANPGGALLTGASLVGAAFEYPATTPTFPQYSVPGVTPATKFDQFPGAPSIASGTVIGYKGNYTVGGVGMTGVFFRDVSRASNLTYVVANSQTRIPNQPSGGTTTFGSTAPPSLAGDYMYFVGSDNEDAPTMGGVYRAKMKDKASQKLETLVGIGAQVPGEAAGTGFAKFGEGLSVSPDGNFVAFWGTWGSESNSLTLYCPTDGNQDLIAYCQEVYGANGYTVAIPVHQGIFVYDVKKSSINVVAKTLQDGIQDLLFWVFSGAPPGVGGNEEDSQELPRWRSSAFAAVSLPSKKNYATAFKALQSDGAGIFLRNGAGPLYTVAKIGQAGRSIDPMAPLDSLVTAVGLERDGFRGRNLAITASMLFETAEESLGWAGIYLTQVQPAD